MKNEKVIGKSYTIKDARSKVTGEKKFVDDIKFSNLLYAKVLYSPLAHAKVISIDTSEAMKVAGVHAIIHSQNTSQTAYNGALRFFEHDIPKTETVFPKILRFVGDRVAAVAAESIESAEKAISLIKVEYEELPINLNPEKALEKDSYPIHEGGNVLNEMSANAGDVDEAFSKSFKVFEDKYDVHPVSPSAMELHVSVADYSYDNKLTVHTTCQNVFAFRILLSQIMDMPLNKIRVYTPAIGGSFGGKLEMTIEPIVAILAKITKKTVKLTLTRDEVLKSTRTRHGAVIKLKTAVSEKGFIEAQEIDLTLNTGAYAGSCYNVLGALSHKVYKIYKTPNMKFSGRPVYTNLPIAGAMRGYGSPQVFFAQQSQLGKIAKELNIDLIELQKINLVEADGIDQRFSSPLGNPKIKDCVINGAEIFNWDERIKKEKNVDGWIRGVGMAVGCHGNGVFGAHRDMTALILKLNEDGSATLITGVHDMGNGTATMQTQMVAEVLGIKPSMVETVEADSDACAWNIGAYASRGVYVEGNAAKHTATVLRLELENLAREVLDVDGDFDFIDGEIISLKHKNKKTNLSDLAVYSQKEKQKELTISESYASKAGITSYGAHFAEILINEKSNEIEVIDYLAVHDVGRVINPIALEGQLEGGIQMGLGYALSEEYDFNEKGETQNNILGKYKLFKSNDMPNIKVHFVDGYEETGPYGAKSIGECAVVPVAPAIANAVLNALGKEVNKTPIKISNLN